MVKTLSRSLVVDVSVERAYVIWCDFAGVTPVERHVDMVRVEGRRLRWRIGREEWESLIAGLTPNERVSWRRLDGPRVHAVLNMSPTDDRRTKVTLGAEYEWPPGEPDDKGARLQQMLRSFQEQAEVLSVSE